MPGLDAAAAAGALVGRGLADRLDRQPLHLGARASSGRSARRRCRRRTGCRARSARSRRRWWRARPGGRCAARRPGAARRRRAGRRAARPRSVAAASPARPSASAVSRISRSPGRNTRMSPGPSADQLARPRRRSPRSGRGRPARPPRRRPASSTQRPVADLDRVGPPGHLDDRRGLPSRREVRGEPLRVDGRGGDDHLEVGAARQQLLEVAEQEVDVEAAARAPRR